MPDENQSSAGSEAEEKDNAASAEEAGEKDGDKGEGEGSDAKDQGDDKGDKDETVTISKKEHDHLTKVAKRKGEKKNRPSQPKDSSSPGAEFSFEKPAKPDEDEMALKQEREHGKFEQGVLRSVLKNKDYQKVLEKDKTLEKVLENNPASLLEETPVDADDAISQITDYLDERVEELIKDPKEKKKEEKKEDEGGQAEPAPPVKTEPAKGEKEKQKTLDDVSEGIMSKVKVGGETQKK